MKRLFFALTQASREKIDEVGWEVDLDPKTKKEEEEEEEEKREDVVDAKGRFIFEKTSPSSLLLFSLFLLLFLSSRLRPLKKEMSEERVRTRKKERKVSESRKAPDEGKERQREKK